MTVVDDREAARRTPTGRVYLDADSHVVETPDWLAPYADPDIRPRLRELDLGAAAASRPARRSTGPAPAPSPARPPLRDDQTVMSAKGWSALGAFDAAERTEALDLLGFHRQLVFSTFAPTQFESEQRPRPAVRRAAGARPGRSSTSAPTTTG